MAVATSPRMPTRKAFGAPIGVTGDHVEDLHVIGFCVRCAGQAGFQLRGQDRLLPASVHANFPLFPGGLSAFTTAFEWVIRSQS